VLIANRGEVAIRIARWRRAGNPNVAVFSEDDARALPGAGARAYRVPSMTRDLEVKVLCVSRSRRTPAKRKVMSREAVAERSVEQNREPTNRNRMQGVVTQSERAIDREAVSAKEPPRSVLHDA